MTEAPPDPRVLTMIRALDRQGKRVDTLETNVRRLAGDVSRLAGVVADRAPAPGSGTSGVNEPAHVRSWLLAAGTDSERLPDDLADLVAWLDLVYLRFPDALLTACWLWHPSVVEELWWLRHAHADAYDADTGSWLRVGDWHDRQRPGVARRIREVLSRCDLSLHTDDRAGERGPAAEPAPAPLAGHAVALAVEWGRSGTRPAPTPEQLDEARALAAAQIRGRR